MELISTQHDNTTTQKFSLRSKNYRKNLPLYIGLIKCDNSSKLEIKLHHGIGCSLPIKNNNPDDIKETVEVIRMLHDTYNAREIERMRKSLKPELQIPFNKTCEIYARAIA